jgi:ligand-binding SRPBCC domain-containing protein
MSSVLERCQLLARDLPATFGFFKNPHNLGGLTPPWLHFRIVSVSDAEIREGTRIRYRLRLHGIPLGWESVISEYAENTVFADRMVSGPYRRWYHRHEFRAVPGGTEMRDRVEYELPFGVLGRMGHLLVERQLRAIFDFRAAAISRMLGGPT